MDGRIEIGERAVPAPDAGAVVVRVHGAGLNRADLLQRAGAYPAPAGSPPDVPGLEFAGVVDRCGSGVTRVEPGDEVFGIAGGGAQAEYLLVPEGQCARVPRGLDLVAMGGVPEAFVTAHDAMVTRAGLQPGEWVLIHAVGSGVGTAALQLARALGARVIGTSRTEAKLDRCREHGLEHGITPTLLPDGTLDADALGWAIVDATGGGADVVVDLVGGKYVEADIAGTALRGRILLVGAIAGARATLPVGVVLGKRLSVYGTVLRARDPMEKAAATAAFEADVVPLLASGTVRPIVDHVVPLDQVADAYDLLASNDTFGKVILDCR